MKKIKIGLAGLGVVGKGVYEILKKDAELISKRTKNQLEIVAVSARTKKDFVDSKVKFYENALDLATDSEVDVVVEVIGGNTLAKNLFEAALKNGKKYVTANKALLAESGFELAQLAESNNTHFAYEASTAGSIPVIKNFKEGLAANEIEEFYAILNGTCNFILTKMEQENLDFSVALKQAQDLGYAESDPTFDIKGIDTAHKLALLAAIADGTKPAFSELSIEGVDEVSIEDINLAKELGYKIKILAVYKKFAGFSQQAVYPALVNKSEKIAQVDDSFNAILTKASNADWNFVVGRGAGGFPTASAVVADLIDIANDRYSYAFGVKTEDLKDANIHKISDRVGGYFLKLVVNKDLAQKTNLAEVIFGDKIKIKKSVFIDKDEEILCGFLTENHKEQDILDALKTLDSSLVKSSKFLRVEEIVGF
jgi:homoserine dehydrogenase